MKVVIGFVLSWLLYALGDAACDVLSAFGLDRFHLWARVWYPVYNRLMCWSSDVQEWAGGGHRFPWQPAADWPDDSEAA